MAVSYANAQPFAAGSPKYTVGGDCVTVKANTKADEGIATPDSVEYGEGEAAKTAKNALRATTADRTAALVSATLPGIARTASAAGGNECSFRLKRGGNITFALPQRHLYNMRRQLRHKKDCREAARFPKHPLQ